MTNQLLTELSKVIKQLSKLEKYTDISDEYYGTDFPNQNKLAAGLENMIMAATHETASQLAFLREDIDKLIVYLKFRGKYQNLSENDLLQLIDNNGSDIQFRMDLKSKLQIENTQEFCVNIQSEWNDLFKESYKKLSDKFNSL